jgi:hypothetical protein
MKDGKYEYDKLKTINSVATFRRDLWKTLNQYCTPFSIVESIHTVNERINSKVIKEFL